LEKTREVEQGKMCYVQIGEKGIQDTNFTDNG
jgi:hypothetical protein